MGILNKTDKELEAQNELELAQLSIEFKPGYVFMKAEENEISEMNRHFDAGKRVLFREKESSTDNRKLD